MSLIDHKQRTYQKEGETDAAARLGLEAEMYAERGENQKAQEAYLKAC
jgi:hypothetical protein